MWGAGAPTVAQLTHSRRRRQPSLARRPSGFSDEPQLWGGGVGHTDDLPDWSRPYLEAARSWDTEWGNPRTPLNTRHNTHAVDRPRHDVPRARPGLDKRRPSPRGVAHQREAHAPRRRPRRGRGCGCPPGTRFFAVKPAAFSGRRPSAQAAAPPAPPRLSARAPPDGCAYFARKLSPPQPSGLHSGPLP